MKQTKELLSTKSKKIKKEQRQLSIRYFLIPLLLAGSFLLFLRGYYAFLLFRRMQESANAAQSAIGKILQVDTGDELSHLISILQISCGILCAACGCYLIFYLAIALKRELLLKEQELKIKALLGTTPDSLVWETLKPAIKFLGYALLTGEIGILLGYFLVYHVISADLSAYLVTPLNFFIHYDVLYLLLFLAVVAGFVYLAYRRIRRDYYPLHNEH